MCVSPFLFSICISNIYYSTKIIIYDYVLFSFSSNYKNRLWRNEVQMKKQERQEMEKCKADGIIMSPLR